MENLFSTLGDILRPENNQVKEAYETLLREYSTIRQRLDQWEAGGILWTWTDVHTYASDEMGIGLSQAECEAILADVIENHDAEIGINWYTFENAIEQFAKQ